MVFPLIRKPRNLKLIKNLRWTEKPQTNTSTTRHCFEHVCLLYTAAVFYERMTVCDDGRSSTDSDYQHKSHDSRNLSETLLFQQCKSRVSLWLSARYGYVCLCDLWGVCQRKTQHVGNIQWNEEQINSPYKHTPASPALTCSVGGQNQGANSFYWKAAADVGNMGCYGKHHQEFYVTFHYLPFYMQ